MSSHTVKQDLTAMCCTSNMKFLQWLHIMVAETFKLSSNVEVIQQPHLRDMKKMQALLCLSLKCSQLWGEMKYLFNHRVWCSTAPDFQSKPLLASSIAHVFLLTCHQLCECRERKTQNRGVLCPGPGLCNFNCGWHCCTDFIICGLCLWSTF